MNSLRCVIVLAVMAMGFGAQASNEVTPEVASKALAALLAGSGSVEVRHEYNDTEERKISLAQLLAKELVAYSDENSRSSTEVSNSCQTLGMEPGPELSCSFTILTNFMSKGTNGKWEHDTESAVFFKYKAVLGDDGEVKLESQSILIRVAG